MIIIGYALITFCLMALSIHLSRKWDQMEIDDQTHYLTIKEKFDTLEKRRMNMDWISRVINIPFKWEFEHVESSASIATVEFTLI